MELCEQIGAAAMGVAPYRVLHEHREWLDTWLAKGFEADLDYMRKHKRYDPRIILPECQSLIVILFTPQKWSYHSYIRRRLKRLITLLTELDPEIIGRGVVDTAPILERAWGVEAGLGWVGRNSMLVHPKFGCDFNIAIVLTNRTIEELQSSGMYDLLSVNNSTKPIESGCELCGSKCMDSCPSGAIQDNHTIDSRICISYLSQQPDSRLTTKGCTLCQQCAKESH